MKVGKPQSKRVSVRLRHKIQKHSANKQRKDRKEAKKNPQWRSRLKKDPGIPNLFPYKDKILAEIEESKRTKEEEKERRRDVAKAQREGGAVGAIPSVAVGQDQEDSDGDGDDDEEMDEREGLNPLAALVASASHRVQAYTKQDDEEDDEKDSAEDEIVVTSKPSKPSKPATKTAEPTKKRLPQKVFDDPIKPVNRLLARLQKTPDGVQQLLEFYQLPPLVTAGSDITTRFLVDVARKRGRLSRGGVPNLHAAALTVLGDLQEHRLKLPALQQQKLPVATSKGKVQIVSQMAEPFRIEGLFGEVPETAEAMDLGA